MERIIPLPGRCLSGTLCQCSYRLASCNSPLDSNNAKPMPYLPHSVGLPWRKLLEQYLDTRKGDKHFPEVSVGALDAKLLLIITFLVTWFIQPKNHTSIGHSSLGVERNHEKCSRT